VSSQPQVVFTVDGKRFTFTVTTGYLAFTENGATGYLKQTFATFLDQDISPIGRGSRAVRPARPTVVLRKPYNVALYLTFTGTAGYFNWYNKRRQYVRPISSQAKALSTAVAVARELSRRGWLWTALVGVHGSWYYVKGFQHWVRKAKGGSHPEVRLYLAKAKVNGLRKREAYSFSLIILYTTEPLFSKAKVTLKGAVQHLIRSLRPDRDNENQRAEGNAIRDWLKRG